MPFSGVSGGGYNTMKIIELRRGRKIARKAETGNETLRPPSQSVIETVSLMYPES
jgi:hypothetical protein